MNNFRLFGITMFSFFTGVLGHIIFPGETIKHITAYGIICLISGFIIIFANRELDEVKE